MEFWTAVAIVVAGMAAGTINTIVGSGTLITFPTLLFFGVPPLAANVSNNIGMVAGGLTGSWGYRHELDGHAPLLRRLMPLSFVGAIAGAVLLLVLPPAAFKAIVPVLIVIALVLVVLGPRFARRTNVQEGNTPRWHGPAMAFGVLFAGMYGGYFGAAQGVLLVGLLSALTVQPLQRINAYKNVLALVVNLVAAVMFLLFAREHIDWLIVLLISVGSLTGGVIGAKIGRRIPAPVLRGVIVAVGVVAIVKLVWFP